MRNFYLEVIYVKEMKACCVCGTLHPVEELTEFDDSWLCSLCLHSETIVCQDCGERLWADDDAGDGSTTLCQSCYDRYYTTCEDCARVIHQDDAYYESDDDYEARCYSCHCRHADQRTIHEYSYKPEPIFFGDGDRHYGIELEIDSGGECSENARRILDVANAGGDEMLYIKRDGSLSDGMELVSHPATIDWHLNHFPWEKIMEKAKSMGYVSHQSGTCGLHFHVNRTAFGETREEQESCIARILYLHEVFWNELLKFSRRTEKQYQQWCARYGLKEHPQEILKHAKGYGSCRYTAVNLCNSDTVEFRIFRGTLRYLSFAAALALVDRICDVACSLSDEEVKNLSWSSFVAGCTQPELVAYLREKRLFVNEPVTAEAEV